MIWSRSSFSCGWFAAWLGHRCRGRGGGRRGIPLRGAAEAAGFRRPFIRHLRRSSMSDGSWPRRMLEVKKLARGRRNQPRVAAQRRRSSCWPGPDRVGEESGLELLTALTLSPAHDLAFGSTAGRRPPTSAVGILLAFAPASSDSCLLNWSKQTSLSAVLFVF